MGAAHAQAGPGTPRPARPLNPQEVPDFYGYGNDLSVNLDTGRHTGEWPAWTWRSAQGLLWLILLAIPVFIVILIRREWRWHGQFEVDIKEMEGHSRGCDCGRCATLQAKQYLKRRKR